VQWVEKLGCVCVCVCVCVWIIHSSNPSKDKEFSKMSRQGPPNMLFSGYYCSFLGLKQPWHKVYNFLPHSAEVKNELSYISIPPHMYSWCRQVHIKGKLKCMQQ